MQSMSLFNEVKSSEWILCFKDIAVCYIDRDSGEVSIAEERFLPFDLALTGGDSTATRVKNVTSFNAWCAKRILSLDRKYAKEILNYYGFEQAYDDTTRANIALVTRCLSLNDSFWVKQPHEDVTWDTVNLFDNSLKDTVFDIALLGRSFTVTNEALRIPDINTDGTAPKAWVRRDDNFYLLKGDNKDSVTREVEASIILNRLGISTVKYVESAFKGVRVSECACFTNKDVNFVRAGRYKAWCERNGKFFYQELKRYKMNFDLMNIADFIIGNADEHPDNWGFLYDSNMNIYGMNLLMDYDHAFESSLSTICTPALMTRGTVSQQQVAIDTINDYKNLLNWDIDLSVFKYGEYVKRRLSILKNVLS